MTTNDLEQAQIRRAAARSSLDDARATLDRAKARRDDARTRIDAAAAARREEEEAQVAELHAAAASDQPIVLPKPAPADDGALEVSYPLLERLVQHSADDVAQKHADLAIADAAVDAAVGAMMVAEAEDLAAQLWIARQRECALRVRLEEFGRSLRPGCQPGQTQYRTVPDPTNPLLKHAVFDPTLAAAHFKLTPVMSRALFGQPGNGQSMLDSGAWGTWAAHLRTDAVAQIAPIPEPSADHAGLPRLPIAPGTVPTVFPTNIPETKVA